MFHQRMVRFVNKLKLSDRKYQANITVKDENYRGKLLFTVRDFMPFGTYFQSTFYVNYILKIED